MDTYIPTDITGFRPFEGINLDGTYLHCNEGHIFVDDPKLRGADKKYFDWNINDESARDSWKQFKDFIHEIALNSHLVSNQASNFNFYEGAKSAARNVFKRLFMDDGGASNNLQGVFDSLKNQENVIVLTIPSERLRTNSGRFTASLPWEYLSVDTRNYLGDSVFFLQMINGPRTALHPRQGAMLDVLVTSKKREDYDDFYRFWENNFEPNDYIRTQITYLESDPITEAKKGVHYVCLVAHSKGGPGGHLVYETQMGDFTNLQLQEWLLEWFPDLQGIFLCSCHGVADVEGNYGSWIDFLTVSPVRFFMGVPVELTTSTIVSALNEFSRGFKEEHSRPEFNISKVAVHDHFSSYVIHFAFDYSITLLGSNESLEEYSATGSS